MDIRQLQHFCEIAEAGSLTAAARHLGQTQAALSRQLAALEAELDTPLFRRNGRGLVLTAPGRILQEHAHVILQQLSQAERAVRASRSVTRGAFALGLPPSLARTVVVPLVEAFQHQLPEVAMRTLDGLSVDLLALVARGRLDSAIVYNASSTDVVDLVPLADEDLYLVSGPLRASLEPELGKAVTLNQVAALPLVVAGGSNAVHLALSTALAALGKEPRVVHEIANLNAILDMVRKGHGYAVVPVSGVYSCIGDPVLRLHRIRRPNLRCKLYIATAAQARDPVSQRALEVLGTVVPAEIDRFSEEIEAAIVRWFGP